jgi:hypothetical protein
MSTKSEQLQNIYRLYEQAGMPTPATTWDIAEWAVAHNLYELRPINVVAQCADELSKALREEFRKDQFGRRYRAKHAVTVKITGGQMTLWADFNTAPREHMQRAFAQRRQQIVGDCHQLKIDVDCYNNFHPTEEPIQLVLDFTMDIMEIEAATGGNNLL